MEVGSKEGDEEQLTGEVFGSSYDGIRRGISWASSSKKSCESIDNARRLGSATRVHLIDTPLQLIVVDPGSHRLTKTHPKDIWVGLLKLNQTE